jgi:hypothetical protein
MVATLGDEADAARLLGADLDVGETHGGHEVDLALVVGELDELGVRVESARDDLLDVGRSLRRLEVDLTGELAIPMRMSTDTGYDTTSPSIGAVLSERSDHAPNTVGVGR